MKTQTPAELLAPARVRAYLTLNTVIYESKLAELDVLPMTRAEKGSMVTLLRQNFMHKGLKFHCLDAR